MIPPSIVCDGLFGRRRSRAGPGDGPRTPPEGADAVEEVAQRRDGEPGAAEGGAEAGRVDGDDGPQARGGVVAEHDLLVGLVRPEDVHCPDGTASSALTTITGAGGVSSLLRPD